MAKALNFWRKVTNGKLGPPPKCWTKWAMASMDSAHAMAPDLALAMASFKVMPPWMNWHKLAATSSSLAAFPMALLVLRPIWMNDGNTGHWSSTWWLMTSHGHPFWTRSKHGSALEISTLWPSSGPQHPWAMALRKAVVWLQLRER